MKSLFTRVLFCTLFSLIGTTQVKAQQITPLDPEWIVRWTGQGNIDGPCDWILAYVCPGNAWDVHVYRDTVWATGVKTESVWGVSRPLVLNAYSLDGDTLLEQTWSESGTSQNGGSGLVLLGHGDYLYLGGLMPIDTMGASLIQKRDLQGNLIWSHGWGDKLDGGHHEVNGLAIVDSFLYVSHYSAEPGTPPAPFDHAHGHIRKFNLNELDAGLDWSVAQEWDIEYGDSISITTTDGHIYADSSGVLICGQYGAPQNSIIYQHGDSYIKKFDPQGNLVWEETWDGNGTGVDNAFNLKSDGDHIYVTGPTATYVHPFWGFPVGLNIDIFVQKYTMDGTLLWTELYGGDDIEYSRGLEVDDEYIYVSATTQSFVDTLNPADENNTLLLKFRKDNGDFVSDRLWSGPGLEEASMSIDQDDHGGLYMSGFTTTSRFGVNDSVRRAVVIKVDKANLASVMEIGDEFTPLSIYPNPFSTATTFHTGVDLKDASLVVYDIYGKTVREINHIYGDHFELTRGDLPSGLFFVELRQDNIVIASDKVIVQ